MTSAHPESVLVATTLQKIQFGANGALEVEESLRTSTEMRENGPLLLDGLLTFIADGECKSGPVLRILRLLPVVCRPRELHMFCMEAWVNLWSRECKCVTPETEPTCNLNLARALAAELVVDLISRTSKGPLSNNRENYLLSIGGQILSKFLMPEALSPRHALSGEWLWVVLSLAQAVKGLNSADRKDMHNQAHAEVAVRLLAGAIECLVVRETHWFSGQVRHSPELQSLLGFVCDDESTLSLVNSRMCSVDAKSASLEDPTTRSADFELFQTDLALFVLASEFTAHQSPRLIPLIWSSGKRANTLLRSAIVLLNSRHIVPGVALSLNLLTAVRLDVLMDPAAAEWVELLLRIATSVGDENFLSLQTRQKVFSEIAKAIDMLDGATARRVCFGVISQSQVDSVVGLAVKLLKDTWVKHDLPLAVFHATVNRVMTSDFPVIDAVDTLKSVLNWARLVYMQNPPMMDSPEDSKFHQLLDILGNKLRVEKAILEQEEASGETEMKKTRLVFIAHLIARVKEIFDSPPRSQCGHSHS